MTGETRSLTPHDSSFHSRHFLTGKRAESNEVSGVSIRLAYGLSSIERVNEGISCDGNLLLLLFRIYRII